MTNKKSLTNNSDIADEIIDSRVVNTLWDYIHDIESDIKQETTKAGYILGFQGTILFIASTKLGALDLMFPKILLMISFIISTFLSFFVIASKGALNHISLLDRVRFDRSIAFIELKEIYTKSQKEFSRKVLLNNINMFFQIIILIVMLLMFLFGNQIMNML